MHPGLAVASALAEFVERIGGLDGPTQRDPVAVLTVRAGGQEECFTLTPAVARAFGAALAGYHDARDRGRCGHCGGRRLDDNFLCRDCARPNGVFGQLLLERAARYPGDPAHLPGARPTGDDPAAR